MLGAKGLEIRDIEQPRIKPGQMLVRVRYAGLNRRDLTRAKGDEGTVPGLWPALEAGKLSLPVDKVYPLDEAEAAHARMRANEHFGKILLRMGD